MKAVSLYILLILIPTVGFTQNDLAFDFRSNQTDFDIEIPGINTINDSIKKVFVHYDVFIGTFIPTQEAKLIGVKPALGASFGVHYGRMTYNLTVEGRFGKTKDPYELSNLDMTDHHSSGYFGVDILRDIWTKNKHQVLLLTGGGVDVFQFVPPKYRDQSLLEDIIFGEDYTLITDSREMVSYNFNFGLMYRFYHKDKSYFGLKYRYNFVDYNSKKILTDLTGNYHTITISFGSISEKTALKLVSELLKTKKPHHFDEVYLEQSRKAQHRHLR